VIARDPSFHWFMTLVRPDGPLVDQGKVITADHQSTAAAGKVQGYVVERK
jgi:hypothetical protein